MHPNTSARAPNALFLRLSQSAQSVPRSEFLASFGAQSRLVLLRRGCFPTLLMGCAVFAHNFMLKLCSFQISSDGGQHGPRCTQGGMLVLYLFSMSNNPRHFRPFPQKNVLCIICTGACSDAIRWVTSSSQNAVCSNNRFCKSSAIWSGLVGIPYRSLLAISVSILFRSLNRLPYAVGHARAYTRCHVEF